MGKHWIPRDFQCSRVTFEGYNTSRLNISRKTSSYWAFFFGWESKTCHDFWGAAERCCVLQDVIQKSPKNTLLKTNKRPLKRDYFSRVGIHLNQPLIFRGHSFVFRGVSLSRKTWELFFGTVTDHSLKPGADASKRLWKITPGFFWWILVGLAQNWKKKKTLTEKKMQVRNHGSF